MSRNTLIILGAIVIAAAIWFYISRAGETPIATTPPPAGQQTPTTPAK